MGVFRDGKEQPGHNIVVQWGCGTDCIMMVILDAWMGKIYGIPLGVGKEGGQRMVLPGLGLSHAEVQAGSQRYMLVAPTVPEVCPLLLVLLFVEQQRPAVMASRAAGR
jgi:hypothetical protein